MGRPIIAIPGRYADTATLIRRSAMALAERLMESVHAAGGEPVMIYPESVPAVASRFAWIDGLLLPGGGDVNPLLYDSSVDSSVNGVNEKQDAFDIELIKWALTTGVPMLAICRGLQVVNVALGGSLEQDMPQPHRAHKHEIKLSGLVAEISGERVTASCFHHQRVRQLAEGLRVLATDDDGTIEAVDRPDSVGWFLGVQWHPEDTAAEDGQQLALFTHLVASATEYSARK